MSDDSFDEFLTESKVFKDASILSPHFVPKALPFRGREIKEIMSLVSPAIKGQRSKNMFIYGKTGCGKTATVKHVMEKFGSSRNNAYISYVNCRIYNSRYRVMQKILKQFVPELEKAGFGLTFLYEKLIEICDKGIVMIVVLDEIDIIKDLDDLVYTLTRVNDELKKGGVSIIGISNRLTFKQNLDQRSKSSLNETEIVFPPYTSEQLKKILTQRVEKAFRDNVVQQGAINLASAITAQESGDARYALKILLKAGETAEQNSKTKVTDEEVESARKKVELDIAQETLSTLPENHQMLLLAISDLILNGTKYSRLDAGEENFLMSGEVYEEYELICKKLKKRPRSVRWYHEYLKDLETLGLVMTTPSTKGQRGHTTLIRLGLEAKIVSQIMKKNFGIN